MQVPDSFCTIYLDGPQWYRTLGDMLRWRLRSRMGDGHPFSERILRAVFDDFDIARNEIYRKAIFDKLVYALSTKSMKTVAKQGADIKKLSSPGGMRIEVDATQWARSSERREKMCPQGALAWFDEEHAMEGMQMEIREIAAAIWKEMEGMRADIADHHENHRPKWEEAQPYAAETVAAGVSA